MKNIQTGKEPVISVVVPVYNVEKYLERCLSSILYQTYSNLEVLVVVDLDCAIDHSAAICLEYEKKDSRIKIINQKNRGLSGARNEALDKLTGEYVMFVDGDDFIDQHIVERMYTTAEETCAELIIGEYRNYFEGDSPSYIPKKANIISNQTAFEMLVDKKYSTCIRTAWGKLYKRRLFDGLYYRENSYCEDMLIIHELIDRANIIVYDPTCYYYYVQENNNSLDRSEFNIRKAVYLEATSRWRDLIHERYPAVYKMAESFHAKSIADILYAMKDIDSEEKIAIQKKYINELKRKKVLWFCSKKLDIKEKVSIWAAMLKWWWLFDLYHKIKR